MSSTFDEDDPRYIHTKAAHMALQELKEPDRFMALATLITNEAPNCCRECANQYIGMYVREIILMQEQRWLIAEEEQQQASEIEAGTVH